MADRQLNGGERAAIEHAVKQSQLYSTAAERHAAQLESEDETAGIDSAVDDVNADESTTFAIAASDGLLQEADEDW